jgi:hypothetical protein
MGAPRGLDFRAYSNCRCECRGGDLGDDVWWQNGEVLDPENTNGLQSRLCRFDSDPKPPIASFREIPRMLLELLERIDLDEQQLAKKD